jgi:hypothetical protein
VRLLVKVHEEVTGLLGCPLPGGMEGDAEDADPPGRVLDDGQDSVESGLSRSSASAIAGDR